MAKSVTKCQLDSNNCVSLQSILEIFDGPVNEERAWALLYQCIRTCETVLESDSSKNLVAMVTEPEHVWIHNDGNVHANTFLYSPFCANADQRQTAFDEAKLLSGIGWTIFAALDYGCSQHENRILSRDLEQLIDLMTSAGADDEERQETDDEGIVQDSADKQEPITFQMVLKRCEQQISSTASTAEADAHFRAVCRALVAETVEFSQFLSRVTKSPDEWRELRKGTEYCSADLGQLHLADWAKLWMQVIRQLRNGVKLKKTDLTRKPIEFELTPYEMLMEDIRSRRYNLRKVQLEEKIPPQLKKDAHAVILEFIRSRPPLRKASERQLPPPEKKPLNPKELLMEAIRLHDHKALRPTSLHKTETTEVATQQRRKLEPGLDIRKLLDEDDDDAMDDSPEETAEVDGRPGSFIVSGIKGSLDDSVILRRGSSCVTSDGPRSAESSHVTTPLAQNPLIRLSACGLGSEPSSSGSGTLSPASPTNCFAVLNPLHLQEEFLQSESFQENLDCLSLNLEELVHIRRVLTEAELDALPLDHALKEDLVNNKVCFVCWKTRFSLFKAWGKKCSFCQRTVCAKCSSTIQLPSSEPFTDVPVFTISPSSPPGSMLTRSSETQGTPAPLRHYLRLQELLGFGSAPSSPAFRRRLEGRTKSLRLSSWKQQSLSADNSPKKAKLGRSLTINRGNLPDSKETYLVCRDCKSLVKHIHQQTVQQQTPLQISVIQ